MADGWQGVAQNGGLLVSHPSCCSHLHQDGEASSPLWVGLPSSVPCRRSLARPKQCWTCWPFCVASFRHKSTVRMSLSAPAASLAHPPAASLAYHPAVSSVHPTTTSLAGPSVAIPSWSKPGEISSTERGVLLLGQMLLKRLSLSLCPLLYRPGMPLGGLAQ